MRDGAATEKSKDEQIKELQRQVKAQAEEIVRLVRVYTY